LPTSGYLNIVKNFHKTEYATYDLKTGEQLSFSSGFAVSFQVNKEPGIMRYYTDDEYDLYVYECVHRSGSMPYVGYYDNPEISFVATDADIAKQMMRDYNQFSIYAFKYASGKDHEFVNEFYDYHNNPIKE